jgi:hypothetical protein
MTPARATRRHGWHPSHRYRWLVTLLAVLAVVVAPMAGSVATRAAAATLMPPGATVELSPPDDGVHYAPAVSDDGMISAWGVTSAAALESRLVVNNRRTGTSTEIAGALWSDPLPSLSGDGSRVAYINSSTQDDAVIRVADTAGADPDRAVTGTAKDLTYQRQRQCSQVLRSGAELPSDVEGLGTPTRGCGPQLSGDGRSVALAAQLSVESPVLKLVDPSTGETFSYADPTKSGTADFGYLLATFPGTADRYIQVQGPGLGSVHIDEAKIDPPGGQFSIVSSECDGVDLIGDAACTVRVRATFLESPKQCGSVLGTLKISSPTPLGRLELGLVATSSYPQSDCGGATPPPPPSCAAPGPIDAGTAEPARQWSLDYTTPQNLHNLG